VLIRPRADSDVAELVAALSEQQKSSLYPLRWPLPFPVEEFIVRAGELASWVAEDGGALLGHVAASTPGDDATGRALRAATGREGIAEVSVLFTTLAARGRGVGGLLMDTAVDFIRSRGLLPVLDVVGARDTALALYRNRGWIEVGRVRPDWMPAHLTGDEAEMVLMELPD
jgi:GNAT superfamily N-acetyltransferase